MKILGNQAVSFPQPQNKEKQLEAIIDGYKNFINHEWYLAEILQKDAIQNSWGARYEKKGTSWQCFFSYYENIETEFIYRDFKIKNLISIRDEGTWGLTGNIPKNEEEVIFNLEKETRVEERLSGFLSQDWTTKEKGDLGSRGRGKAIFIASSKEKFIFFDSLRKTDNRYIFGAIFIDKNKKVQQELLKDDEAKIRFREIFKDKTPPLNKSGTRIIIINPEDKLIESFLNRKLDFFIQSTWWEILAKYKTNIKIKIPKESERIIEKSTYLPIVNDNLSYILETPIKIGGYGKIKRISFRFLENLDEIPKEYLGISIQRGGMLIQRYPTKNLLDEEFSENIYGHIEFDKDLEIKMQEQENAEHYGFYWTSNPPALVLKELKKALKEFAKKLNLLEKYNASITEQQKKLHKEVKELLSKIARKFKIFGSSYVFPQSKETNEKEKKFLIRLSFADLKFPGESKRINYGQSLNNVYLKLINETNKDIKVKVSILILKSINPQNEKILDSKVEEITIPKDTTLLNSNLKIGWEKICIDKNWEKGRYVIKGVLTALEDLPEQKKEKGHKLYKIYQAFYVEDDPLGKDIFDIRVINTDRKYDYIKFDEEDDKIILTYNQQHPKIKKYLVNNDKKSQGVFKEFLFNEGLNYLIVKLFNKDSSSDSYIEKNNLDKYKDNNDLLGRFINDLLKKKGDLIYDF